jgi:hypothetical protein
MHNKNIHLMGRLRSIHKNLVHHANNAKHVFGLGAAHKKMGMGGMIKHKKNHSYEEEQDNCGGRRKRRLVPLKFKY